MSSCAPGPPVFSCESGSGFLGAERKPLQKLYSLLAGYLLQEIAFLFNLQSGFEGVVMSVALVNLNARACKITSLPSQRKRMLVADDSATILHAICTLLEHHKIAEIVGRAENGSEAIDRVSELQPELVLLDADMPGMSGLRTALLISQMHPQVEIILMSMDTSAQFRAACAGCGAAAMIYKPRFLQELRDFLHCPVQRPRAAAGLRA